MRYRRITDERAKRNGIEIENNSAENGALCNSAGKRAEAELSGGIPTVDVRDERYEVNHCSETEEIRHQMEKR